MHPYDGRVISNLIVQALIGHPVTIYGDGSQSICFCFIDDLIDAFILFMDNYQNETGPINIGNPNDISINDAARMIVRLTASVSEIIYEILPSDGPIPRCPDITKAKSYWGGSQKLL